MSLVGRPWESFGLTVRWEASEACEQEPGFKRPWLGGESRLWEVCVEAARLLPTIQAEYETGLDRGGGGGENVVGKKCSDSKSVLEVKLVELADGLGARKPRLLLLAQASGE